LLSHWVTTQGLESHVCTHMYCHDSSNPHNCCWAACSYKPTAIKPSCKSTEQHTKASKLPILPSPNILIGPDWSITTAHCSADCSCATPIHSYTYMCAYLVPQHKAWQHRSTDPGQCCPACLSWTTCHIYCDTQPPAQGQTQTLPLPTVAR
jgi:hypothetical protein